jgi:hypothetical protein
MSIDEQFDADDFLEGDKDDTDCMVRDAIDDGLSQCRDGIESCEVAHSELEEYYQRVKEAIDDEIIEWTNLQEKIEHLEYHF